MPLIILCLILFVCLFVCPFVRMMAGRANHLCKVHFDHVHMICALFIRYIYIHFAGGCAHFYAVHSFNMWNPTESYTPLRITIKRDAMSSKTNSIEIWMNLTIQKKYLKTRNMIFFSKLNLRCCHFKINQYKHTYDQLAHMILLTLHSSMFTMAIIFSSFSVVFLSVVYYFRIFFSSISCCVFFLY